MPSQQDRLQLCFQADRDLVGRIDKAARAEDRSRASWIRLVIRQALASGASTT